jgi:hypothetical protein
LATMPIEGDEVGRGKPLVPGCFKDGVESSEP